MAAHSSEVHIRRLISPTPAEFAAALQILRISFAQSTFFRILLGGDVAPHRVAAIHALFLKAALVQGEGEVWVAELEIGEEEDSSGGMRRKRREMVGVVTWFLPGAEFLGSKRQRDAAGWSECAAILGEQQVRWLEEYYLPRIGAFWERSMPLGTTHLEAYELCKLAVLPSSHNIGIASLLVWPLLSRAVREGRLVLGETSSAGNLAKYTHVGAQGVGEEVFYSMEALQALKRGERREPAFKLWGMVFRGARDVENAHWDKTEKTRRRSEMETEIVRARL